MLLNDTVVAAGVNDAAQKFFVSAVDYNRIVEYLHLAAERANEFFARKHPVALFVPESSGVMDMRTMSLG